MLVKDVVLQEDRGTLENFTEFYAAALDHYINLYSKADSLTPVVKDILDREGLRNPDGSAIAKDPKIVEAWLTGRNRDVYPESRLLLESASQQSSSSSSSSSTSTSIQPDAVIESIILSSVMKCLHQLALENLQAAAKKTGVNFSVSTLTKLLNCDDFLAEQFNALKTTLRDFYTRCVAPLRAATSNDMKMFCFDRDDTLLDRNNQLMHTAQIIPFLRVVDAHHLLGVITRGASDVQSDALAQTLKASNITVKENMYSLNATKSLFDLIAAAVSELNLSREQIQSILEVITLTHYLANSKPDGDANEKAELIKQRQQHIASVSNFMNTELAFRFGPIRCAFTLQQVIDTPALASFFHARKPLVVLEYLNNNKLIADFSDFNLGGARIYYSATDANWLPIRTMNIVGVDDEEANIIAYQQLGIQAIHATDALLPKLVALLSPDEYQLMLRIAIQDQYQLTSLPKEFGVNRFKKTMSALFEGVEETTGLQRAQTRFITNLIQILAEQEPNAWTICCMYDALLKSNNSLFLQKNTMFFGAMVSDQLSLATAKWQQLVKILQNATFDAIHKMPNDSAEKKQAIAYAKASVLMSVNPQSPNGGNGLTVENRLRLEQLEPNSVVNAPK